MTTFTIALVVGFLAGFLGAIPPGPINVTVIRKSSRGEVKDALRVALGGALIDTLICGLIGLGFGWLLAVVMTRTAVKLVLALFLVAYGTKILLVDWKREVEGNGGGAANGAAGASEPVSRKAGLNVPFLLGILQGAANPALIVNWTLLTGFLVGHRLLATGPGPAAGFAIGIGIGVFTWFLLLAELVDRLRNRPAGGEWVRKSTTVAGVLLVAFGLFFSLKTVIGF